MFFKYSEGFWDIHCSQCFGFSRVPHRHWPAWYPSEWTPLELFDKIQDTSGGSDMQRKATAELRRCAFGLIVILFVWRLNSWVLYLDSLICQSGFPQLAGRLDILFKTILLFLMSTYYKFIANPAYVTDTETPDRPVMCQSFLSTARTKYEGAQ